MEAMQRSACGSTRRGFLFQTLPAAGFAALAATCGGCGGPTQSLAEARAGFKTKIVSPSHPGAPARDGATGFTRTTYPAPGGKYDAYLVPPPDPTKRGPIVIWVHGGDCNSTDQNVSIPGPPENDQTGSPIYKAGIGMMYPSFRGGNLNSGFKEGFYGELDDLAAARAYALTLPWVDPERVYLAGHSTGGTMTLLSAEYTPGYRAVFSIGPVAESSEYVGEHTYHVPGEPTEVLLRSPIHWLHSVQSPTFVFAGGRAPSNAGSVQKMKASNNNPLLHFDVLDRVDHFTIVTPLTTLIASKILADTGEKCNIAFTPEELAAIK